MASSGVTDVNAAKAYLVTIAFDQHHAQFGTRYQPLGELGALIGFPADKQKPANDVADTEVS